MKKIKNMPRLCLGTAMFDRQYIDVYISMAFPESNNEHKLKAILFLKENILKVFQKYDKFKVNHDVIKSIVETASKEIDLTNKFSKPIFAESFGLLVKILAKSMNNENNTEILEHHLCNEITELKPNYCTYKKLQKSKQKDFDEIIRDFQGSSLQR